MILKCSKNFREEEMGKENLKVYALETKENFILYLRQLIISTHVQIKYHQRYIDELRGLIELNRFDNHPTKKINPYMYIDINNKIGNVSNKLLNLIGDQTNTAMSYLKFRVLAKKRMGNGLDLGLTDLTSDMWGILRELNEWRNWALHMPESLFTAELELLEKAMNDRTIEVNPMPNNPIKITEFNYYEAAWLIDLLKETESMHDGFSKSFQQMKMDYSVLIGESMRVEYRRFEVRPIKDMDVPKISMEIQQRKYKGVSDDVWLDKEHFE
jgi:hypothetical protein